MDRREINLLPGQGQFLYFYQRIVCFEFPNYTDYCLKENKNHETGRSETSSFSLPRDCLQKAGSKENVCLGKLCLLPCMPPTLMVGAQEEMLSPSLPPHRDGND